MNGFTNLRKVALAALPVLFLGACAELMGGEEVTAAEQIGAQNQARLARIEQQLAATQQELAQTRQMVQDAQRSAVVTQRVFERDLRK